LQYEHCILSVSRPFLFQDEQRRKKEHSQYESARPFLFLFFSSLSGTIITVSRVSCVFYILQISYTSATSMLFTSWLLLISFTFVYSQSMFIFQIIIIIIIYIFNIDCSDYYSCQLELYDRLLRQSRPSIRPIDKDSKKINVNIGFSLIRLVSVVCYFAFLRKRKKNLIF